MTEGLELVSVGDDKTRAAAKELLEEYLEWFNSTALESYGLTFDIGGMAASDIEDTQKFYPPNGRFYLVVHEDKFVGVGCLKRLDDDIGEVQRMYVRPSARGLGAGRLIIDRLIADARTIGYRTLRLESLKVLTAAHKIYRAVGFVDIPPYSGHGMDDYQSPGGATINADNTFFMEMNLLNTVKV
jgi:GNAT superfamily N-acetyltransferase